MNCYECGNVAQAGGTHFGIRQAVGVCLECGVGLCPEHAKKAEGQPFLCSECRQVRDKRTADKSAA